MDELDEFLERLVRIELNFDSDKAEDEIEWPEFDGFYYPPDYNRDTWMQNRKHGTYPRAGAYNDQDPKWVRDQRYINMRYNAWFDYYLLVKKEQEKSGERDAMPRLEKMMAVSPASWDDLMKD